MKLKISRQYLEDISTNFLPFMIMGVASRLSINKGTELGDLERICLSVLQDIDVTFKKKLLTVQHNFKITLTEAEGIIFMKILLRFPLPADQHWRHNLRNYIIEQLDKQLV